MDRPYYEIDAERDNYPNDMEYMKSLARRFQEESPKPSLSSKKKFTVDNNLDDYMSLRYGDVGEPTGGSPMEYVDFPAKALIPFMGERGMSRYIADKARDIARKRSQHIGGNWGNTLTQNGSNADVFAKQLRESWDNMPEEVRDFQVRNMLENDFTGGFHYGIDRNGKPIAVSHFNPNDYTVNVSSIDIPAQSLDQSRTVNHELGHYGDFTIGSRFERPNIDDTYRSMQTGFYRYIPTMKGTNAKSIEDNWRMWNDRMLDKYGSGYESAIDDLGDLMIDNAYIKPNRRVRNNADNRFAHDIEYREDQAAAHRKTTNPIATASNIEGLANSTELMGVNKGADLLMKEQPKMFDEYIRLVGEDPRNEEYWYKFVVPEQYRR